jgi:hypothetical protein
VTTAHDVIREQFAASAAHLRKVLADITDPEFFWEPVAGCWTVHDRAERRATSADGSGKWVIDYELPEPDPAPITTIAWRTVHVAAVNQLYWDYAFGPATATFDLEMPGTARDALQWLADIQHQLMHVLAAYDSDDALEEIVPTNWGDRWPVGRIFTTLVNEQVHHGAEISLLRDLYRNRASLASG